MIYHNLYAQSKIPVTTVGLIGTGHFGTSVLIQSLKHRRLRIAAIADKNLQAIRDAFQKAGIADGDIAFCNTLDEALLAASAGKFIGVTDPMILMDLPLDTIAEATGSPEAGAAHALSAIEHGKNIIMVNKETDSCVGPILKRLADKKGVVCTPIDGDQHGALIQMVEWARDTGMEVICAGKSRDAEFVYDRDAGTVTVYCDGGITIPKTVTVAIPPEDRRYIEELPDDEQAAYLARRKDLMGALDPRGGFDLCEMVIAANSTGLTPATPLLFDHILSTPQIPKVLCEKKDGGILPHSGVIEVVTNLHEKREAGLGGGVFMVVHCENAYSQMILATKGCLSNSSGTVSLVYRPYHLCGVEAPTTLLSAGLLHTATGPLVYNQRFDIAQEAKTDLKAGDVMGNDHDPRLLTRMVPMSPLAEGGPIPAHMLNGRALICDVPRGTVITYGMVKPPEDSLLWRLREMQDKEEAAISLKK